MRPILFAGLIFAAPAAGFAQSGQYLATADVEVKLRAGPSDQYPETATLAKGSAVLVDHEEANGWLAVLDGIGQVYSVSWVQMQFVDFDPKKRTPQRVVVTDDATLRPGQIGSAQPITKIQKHKVPAGSILTVIGEKVTFEGKTWYPVAQSAGDFRYLPKQAVHAVREVNASFTVRDVSPAAPTASLPGVGSVVPASGSGAAAGKPVVQNPLWAQADAAERGGKVDEAERLFFQLARQMNEPGGDHDIANHCYTRIHTLREKKRAGSGSTVTTRPSAEPVRPTAGGGTLPPAADPRDERARWTGPGKLVRSAVAPDGKRTYALESNPGITVFYVTPAQGVELERYVGRRVDVYGASATRTGLTKPVVVATDVQLAQ